MRKNLPVFLLFFLLTDLRIIQGQVSFQSTTLPIVFINTNYQQISDEPKITAAMAVIDNGYNITNYVTDKNYTYNNNIGIEKRGSISQTFLWPQKSYNLETRDSLGIDNNVPLMKMPIESDWVLYGPYDDHTLMRNVLTYQLVRQMGYWAPRTKYCELIMKTSVFWEYKGVYVMMEKIKRDKNRVNISKLEPNDNTGDALTGGYIIAVDKNINKPDSGWFSSHSQNSNLFYTYKYPKGDEITPPQKTHIKSYMNHFENAISGPNFTNPSTGYREYMDVTSFIDFFFIQELSKNIDAYKRSAWLYKDKDSKGGKLIAGPHWDYNSAYGITLCGFDNSSGWTYPMSCWINQSYPVPFWWSRLLQDTSYTNEMKCRWTQLRSTVLSTANIFHIVDSVANYVAQASTRQFAQHNIGANYQAEVNTLKNWFTKRLTWLDANMPGTCSSSVENPVVIFPNPTDGKLTISGLTSPATIEIYDSIGRKIHSFFDYRSKETIVLNGLSQGLYFIKINSKNYSSTEKIILAN